MDSTAEGPTEADDKGRTDPEAEDLGEVEGMSRFMAAVLPTFEVAEDRLGMGLEGLEDPV